MEFPHFVEFAEFARENHILCNLQVANKAINQASHLQDCFIFYDPQLHVEYIYFGSHSQPKKIKRAMKYGEILAAKRNPISVKSY